jgi:hypothetical protein
MQATPNNLAGFHYGINTTLVIVRETVERAVTKPLLSVI